MERYGQDAVESFIDKCLAIENLIDPYLPFAQKKKVEKPGWKSLPEADLIVGGGTAREFKTGDWRSERPIHIPEKCIHCLTCFMYCPDSATRNRH